jgi:hypothetical protein
MERISDILILGAALVGLASSFILVGFGIASFPAPLLGLPAALAEYTLLGLFPVGGACILRLQQLNRDRTQREIEATRYSGCPAWMRKTAYSFMAAGVILFFLPAILEFSGTIQPSSGGHLPATTPGGFGLMAYSAFIAQLVSAKANGRA